MRAGTLDRRIDIQRKSSSQSDSGEQLDVWSSIAINRPASYRPLNGDERFSGEQWVAREQVEFRIRWEASLIRLGALDRIIYPADVADSPSEITELETYDIMVVHEIGRREGIQILAARRADIS